MARMAEAMAVNQPTAAASAIEARGVTKELGSGDGRLQILKGINLVVTKGEMLAIMGPSGSGKSTLLGCLSGLDAVTDGQVLVSGTDITHLSENALAAVRNEHIGFIFQTFNLIGTLTAQENIELPVMLDSHPKAKPSKRAIELLNIVGPSQRAKHRPSQMSGGEQQRVSIARALANDPEVLFADEPTGNLDSVNSDAIMNLLIDLKQRMAKTLIVVTHDPDIAARCDRTVYMQDGLLQSGPQAHPVGQA
jgi:putative ABC transport system ATP-binding protein